MLQTAGAQKRILLLSAEAGQMVHACGSLEDGDRDQRGTARNVRAAQSLSRKARRCRGGRSPISSLSTAPPIANVKLLEDPGKNLVVIMEDGKIFKNTIVQ